MATFFGSSSIYYNQSSKHQERHPKDYNKFAHILCTRIRTWDLRLGAEMVAVLYSIGFPV